MSKNKEDDFDDEIIIISFARCPSHDEYGRGVMERRSICVCGTVKDGDYGNSEYCESAGFCRAGRVQAGV